MQTSFFGQSIDLTNAKPAGEYTPLEAGWYSAMLTDIEMVSKDWGLLAKVTFKVTEGPAINRQFRDNMTVIHNGSSQANDIGQGRLRAWCDALGIPPNLSSADPLLHKVVMVKVKVETGSDYKDKNGEIRKGQPQNRIETFKAYGPTPAQQAPAVSRPPVSAPSQTATPAAPAAAAPRGQLPWEKRVG